MIKETLKTKGSFKIVFLGDSITAAEWVHPNWREIVEYVLKDKLGNEMADYKLPWWGIRCINSGFDGATTCDWLSKLQADVLDYKPDMVIIMNDSDFEYSIPEHKENIQRILATLTEGVVNVVYCTNLATNNELYNIQYYEFVKEALSLFPMKNVLFVNLFEEYHKLNRKDFFTFASVGIDTLGIKPGEIDFLHPNQLGNAYIAKIILEKVFDIRFDPEKYMADVQNGKMFPTYYK